MVPATDLHADQDPERHDRFEPADPFDSADIQRAGPPEFLQDADDLLLRRGVVPWTARSKPSPCFAASANVPADALLPAFWLHATSSALLGLREPIFTSWPRTANPLPNARPTSPLPSMPIFMPPRRRPSVYAALGPAR